MSSSSTVSWTSTSGSYVSSAIESWQYALEDIFHATSCPLNLVSEISLLLRTYPETDLNDPDLSLSLSTDEGTDFNGKGSVIAWATLMKEESLIKVFLVLYCDKLVFA